MKPRAMATEKRQERVAQVPKTTEATGMNRLMCCFYSKQRDEDESSSDISVLPNRLDRIQSPRSGKENKVANGEQETVAVPSSGSQDSASAVPKLPPVAAEVKKDKAPVSTTSATGSTGSSVEAKASAKPNPAALVTQAPDGGASSSKSQPQVVVKTARLSGKNEPLLPPKEPRFEAYKTLVLDLDETLVHSSFTEVPCDLVLSVMLGSDEHKVYVRKRPGLEQFMATVSQLYEVAVFTASTALYANSLLDVLDTSGWIQHRLFREACTRYKEGYVKDLSRLGRDLNHVIIIDNMPICYALQPHNAIPIQTWKDDPKDTELLDLLPILMSLARVDQIPRMLKSILSDEAEEEAG